MAAIIEQCNETVATVMRKLTVFNDTMSISLDTYESRLDKLSSKR